VSHSRRRPCILCNSTAVILSAVQFPSIPIADQHGPLKRGGEDLEVFVNWFHHTDLLDSGAALSCEYWVVHSWCYLLVVRLLYTSSLQSILQLITSLQVNQFLAL
jgi:hypothetical protein